MIALKEKTEKKEKTKEEIRQEKMNIHKSLIGKTLWVVDSKAKTGGYFADVIDIKDQDTFIMGRFGKRMEIDIFDIRNP